MEEQMGTICTQDTDAFKFTDEAKGLERSRQNAEHINIYFMPEKIISYETTDSEYLLRKNRLSDSVTERFF